MSFVYVQRVKIEGYNVSHSLLFKNKSYLFFFFRTNEAILLALYEAVHLNRNFITVLAQVGYLRSPNPGWAWWPAPLILALGREIGGSL